MITARNANEAATIIRQLMHESLTYYQIGELVDLAVAHDLTLTVDMDPGTLEMAGEDLSTEFDDLAPGEAFVLMDVSTPKQLAEETSPDSVATGRIEEVLHGISYRPVEPDTPTPATDGFYSGEAIIKHLFNDTVLWVANFHYTGSDPTDVPDAYNWAVSEEMNGSVIETWDSLRLAAAEDAVNRFLEGRFL